MSQNSPDLEKKWTKPTAKQRLSHRTILRFVELADQLARDLSTILLHDSRKEAEQNASLPLGVHFISVNRHNKLDQPSKANQLTRYYNLGLLKTFRLFDQSGKNNPINTVWVWIKNNHSAFQPLFRCSDYLEGHSHNRYRLFEKCISEAKSLSESNKESDKEREKVLSEKVHDLLIEAIAAMPYTGLLPSALDKWFCKEDWKDIESDPVLFSLKFGDGNVYFYRNLEAAIKGTGKEIEFINDPKELIPEQAFPENIELQEKDKPPWHRLGDLYINRFINWFALGAEPSEPKNGSPSSYTPYADGSKDFEGFAIPIHHFVDRKSNPVGGFEGWAIVYGDSHQKAFDILSKNESTKYAVTLALRSFGRRLREERMRELIEREWLTDSELRAFTLQHFQEFDGWVAERNPVGKIPHMAKDLEFALLVSEKNKSSEISFRIYDPENRCPDNPPQTKEIKSISHIAVKPPSDPSGTSASEEPLLFRRRADTLLPKSPKDIEDYGFHITQAVGQIYNAARLKERATQSATQLLAKDFAHQVQHISGAISAGWLIKEDNYRNLIASNLKSTPEVRVAPLPELYRFADDVLKLWSTQHATDLFGSDFLIRSTVSLADILNIAAALAKAEWVAENAKGYSLHLPGRIEKVQELINRGEELSNGCNFSALAAIKIIRRDTMISNEMFLAYVRLFQTLIFNAFRHSKSAVVAHLSNENLQAFRLSNTQSETCNPAGNGESVIQNLSRKAKLRVLEGKCENDRFSRIIINFGTLWER